ncbi:MAG: STAS domain-containing protein [Solirubrobacterales bacterium]|nr:STAS domain-containing protein [Solirubrobacterales bacterium]
MTKNASPGRGGTRAEQISKLGELSVRSRREGDVHTIGLAGEVDIATAAQVEQELLRAEATDVTAIVLDLGELSFIDSTGIRMLVMADARSRANGCRLTLRRPPQSVLRVLRLAGVEKLLPFADTG